MTIGDDLNTRRKLQRVSNQLKKKPPPIVQLEDRASDTLTDLISELETRIENLETDVNEIYQRLNA